MDAGRWTSLKLTRRRVLLTFSLTDAAADFGKQRVFAGLTADGQIGAIRFSKPGTFQPFSNASLIVINDGEIAISRHVVHEKLKGFATAIDTLVELGIGLDKLPGF